ncbi:uncharacterized protein [Clytia hemisphaerica]|uniref:VPS9 domain-containing protein n=1 Tax=Clytia hemisphaerica TaxID=252671 RepID=A0A7M5V335_9CNID
MRTKQGLKVNIDNKGYKYKQLVEQEDNGHHEDAQNIVEQNSTEGNDQNEKLEHLNKLSVHSMEALSELSIYLNELTTGANNIIDVTVTLALFEAFHRPEFKDYTEEDKSLHQLIESLAWIEPEHLGIEFDLKDDKILSNFSHAVYCVAMMTTRDDPFQMIKDMVDCVKHVGQAAKDEVPADKLVPMVTFVLLKSNPQKLYSHLKHISAFFELNMQTHGKQDDHRIKYAIPSFYMNEMGYCFITMQAAVTDIKSMIVCEDTKKIMDERKEISQYYIQTENLEASFSDNYKERMNEYFNYLKEILNECIAMRINIRDAHREDMEAIAKRLDDNKLHANIAKTVGLCCSIGGGIVGIVGFGLMFTTFGASAIMIPVGASIGGSGGLAASIATFAEYGIARSKTNQIKKKREEYEKKVIELLLCIQNIGNMVEAWGIRHQHVLGTAGRTLLLLTDVVVKLARLGVAAENIGDVAANVFRLAGAAGRGLAIAGVVINIVLLPIDMVFLGISIKNIIQKSQQAKAIRDWLNQNLPDENEIDEFVTKLQDSVLDFSSDVRGQKSKETLEQRQEDLKTALNEIKEMVEKKLAA